MKTRIEFAPEDFEGCGQMIIRLSANGITASYKDRMYAVTVAYKIGYIPTRAGNKYAMVSLADGMVGRQFDTIEALCEHLNQDQVGFRPMTKNEIRDVLGDQGNRFS